MKNNDYKVPFELGTLVEKDGVISKIVEYKITYRGLSVILLVNNYNENRYFSKPIYIKEFLDEYKILENCSKESKKKDINDYELVTYSKGSGTLLTIVIDKESKKIISLNVYDANELEPYKEIKLEYMDEKEFIKHIDYYITLYVEEYNVDKLLSKVCTEYKVIVHYIVSKKEDEKAIKRVKSL